MHNNGQCYLWLRSDLTLSTLNADSAAIVNGVHAQIPDPKPAFQQKVDYAAGDMNPYILLLNDLAMGGAPFTRASGQELACCGPIANKEFLVLDCIRLLVAFGGDVEAYQMFLEVEDLDATIPGNLPFSGLKWSDISPNGTFPWVEIDGKFYRGTEMPTSIVDRENDGQHMHASEWLQLMQLGVSVLTYAQFEVIKQANSTPPT